ncbi:hypothetical protein [Paenibacillus sp. P36]|uniref:hypothetical protein n=1 Tax=Paenibacillus sp. P36 TaxID=3342538 RepID=UPI0038B2562A
MFAGQPLIASGSVSSCLTRLVRPARPSFLIRRVPQWHQRRPCFDAFRSMGITLGANLPANSNGLHSRYYRKYRPVSFLTDTGSVVCQFRGEITVETSK